MKKLYKIWADKYPASEFSPGLKVSTGVNYYILAETLSEALAKVPEGIPSRAEVVIEDFNSIIQ